MRSITINFIDFLKFANEKNVQFDSELEMYRIYLYSKIFYFEVSELLPLKIIFLDLSDNGAKFLEKYLMQRDIKF